MIHNHRPAVKGIAANFVQILIDISGKIIQLWNLLKLLFLAAAKKEMYLSYFLLTFRYRSDIFVLVGDKYITLEQEEPTMSTNKSSNSKRPRWLLPVLGGAACIPLTAAAVWYDLTYNSGKLVYPMNSYEFQPTDIPMLLALALDVLYVLYLFVLLLGGVLAQRRRTKTTNRTRRLNPKLGLLGFLGFFGLAGFWSYSALGNMTPFAFFAFFGFFGFFFEGKMSNILMDERFKENAVRAELKAYRVGFTAIFLLLVLAGWSSRSRAEIIAPVLMAGIALATALTMFLSEYLLYRYDHDDAAAMEEEE